MEKRVAYLWRTLLALVREQLEAIDKLARGDLGMWGKARFQSRNKEIQKFLFELLKRKVETHGENTPAALEIDLRDIEGDKKLWNDVIPEQLKYVRSILATFG